MLHQVQVMAVQVSSAQVSSAVSLSSSLLFVLAGVVEAVHVLDPLRVEAHVALSLVPDRVTIPRATSVKT